VGNDGLMLRNCISWKEVISGRGGEGHTVADEKSKAAPASRTRSIPPDQGVTREWRWAGGSRELSVLKSRYENLPLMKEGSQLPTAMLNAIGVKLDDRC